MSKVDFVKLRYVIPIITLVAMITLSAAQNYPGMFSGLLIIRQFM